MHGESGKVGDGQGVTRGHHSSQGAKGSEEQMEHAAGGRKE